MSYLRPIRKEELIEWLEAIDYEALLIEDFAQKLIDKFDMLVVSNKAV